MSIKIFQHNEHFELESGSHLPELSIAYQTFGTLNADKSNVVWAFHALSANANVMEWWPGLFGESEYFNPSDHFIVCSNVIGSPYGSTAPQSVDFPQFSVRDVVSAQLLLAKELHIDRIHVAIGGSFGGSQALEFAYSFKGKIDYLILVACAAKESAWGIAIHEAQRLALKADASFGDKNGGKKGLKATRAIGMLTYRTSHAYNTQQTDVDERTDDFKAASYIRYQGEKFEKRFDALSYYYLTKCMDSHNVGRKRGGLEVALTTIKANTLVIGISSDQLLPPTMQQFLAENIPNASYQEIDSAYGHDGFLVETEKLTDKLSEYMNSGLIAKEVAQRISTGSVTGQNDKFLKGKQYKTNSA